MKLCNKKIGFTLAEVLIVLGIIGIVAAMTIPSLISEHNKKATITRLRKAVSTFQQALKLSEGENGEYTQWEELSEENYKNWMNTYWVPYLKIAKKCDSFSDCGYASEYPFVYSDGTRSTFTPISVENNSEFYILSDGTTFSFFKFTWVNKTFPAILIDINGAQKPNMYGKDVFVLNRNPKGYISGLTYYENSRTYLINECKAGGMSCARLLEVSGWEISEDYPIKF